MADQEEEYYGYYYGEEEDKGLLDPAWERQQKKVTWPVTFTCELLFALETCIL